MPGSGSAAIIVEHIARGFAGYYARVDIVVIQTTYGHGGQYRQSHTIIDHEGAILACIHVRDHNTIGTTIKKANIEDGAARSGTVNAGPLACQGIPFLDNDLIVAQHADIGKTAEGEGQVLSMSVRDREPD